MKRGSKQSPEAVEKMRAAARAWWSDPENRAKTVGRTLTPEHREKLRQAKLANPVKYWLGKERPSPSAETLAKRSASLRGKTITPEHRAILAALWTGRQRSPETVAKMRAALSRPEAREKMRQAVLGKPCRHAKHPVFYNGRRFRSTYEVRVAQALDSLGVAWEYEPRRFSFGTFTYCPDFYLPADGAFWEVKGWYGPNSRRAVEAFRREHHDIPLVLVTRQCIEALEAAAAHAA